MSNTDISAMPEKGLTGGIAAAPADAAREPVRPPEGVVVGADAQAADGQAEEQKAAPEKKPVKFLGATLPGPIADGVRTVQGWGKSWRAGAIRKLPAPIVNNSPNMIGAMQLTAELAMFKANGSDLVSPENVRKPLHYLIDPPANVWRSVSGRAGFQVKAKDFFTKDFYKNSVGNFRNVEAATIDDLKHGPLINRWQARATFAGLVGWGINFITPNAQERPEEVEKLVKLQEEHPVRYVGECFRRAVVFPFLTVAQLAQKAVGHTPSDPNEQIGSYKRYFSGLGMLVAGTCSFLGGWRNVSRAGGVEKYYHNWQYSTTGLITAMSSLPLLFSVDNDRGYSRFGAIHLLRCAFLPGSIIKKYKSADKNVEWYIGGHGILQSKNLFAALVGGAKKIVHPDGTVEIIDHTDEIQHAKQEVREAKEHKKQEKAEAKADEKIEKANENIEQPTLEKQKSETQAEKVKHSAAPVNGAAVDDAENKVLPLTQVMAPKELTHAMPERVAVKQREAQGQLAAASWDRD